VGQFSKLTELWAGKADQLGIFPFMVDWRRRGDGNGGRGFESHPGQIIFLDEQKLAKDFWGWGNRFRGWFNFFQVHKILKMWFKSEK